MILLELKYPPAIYPPSLVAETEVIWSSLLSLIDCACIVVGLFSSIFSNFITIPSLKSLSLLFIIVYSPTVILSVSNSPPITKHPSLVSVIEFIPCTFSMAVANSTFPSALYFIIIPLDCPFFIRV